MIFLCWLIYSVSYLGKVNYSANITQIIDFYNVTKAEAGLVPTFFFFAYGIGQVVNGIMCKKYNKKFIFPSVLFASSVLNLLILWLPFVSFKFVWIINGFLQSCLWSSIINVLGTNLDSKHMEKALIVMSTTATAGTIFTYGSSAFFVWLGNYRIAFVFAACLMSTIALLWLLIFKNNPVYEKPDEKKEKTEKKLRGVGIIIGALALFAVIDNLDADTSCGKLWYGQRKRNPFYHHSSSPRNFRRNYFS